MSHRSDIIIVFDTETTGLSPKFDQIVQLSYIVYDIGLRKVLFSTTLGDDIVAVTRKIPKFSTDVHGIKQSDTKGRHLLEDHINQFIYWCNQAGKIIGHNVGFDIRMINSSIERIIKSYKERDREVIASRYFDFLSRFHDESQIFCTLKGSRTICRETMNVDKKKQKYKLDEVHKLLFKQEAKGQLHNALVDISATLRVYLMLVHGIDICLSFKEGDSSVISKLTSVSNDNEICKLINPVPYLKPVESVIYDGNIVQWVIILSVCLFLESLITTVKCL